MKKYIIEFSEDPYTIRLLKIKNGDECSTTEFKAVTPYTEPDIEKIRKEAFDEGYKEGMQLSIDDAKLKEAYQRGLENAWEAARKIAKLDTDEQKRLFGCFGIYFVAHEFSAPEAIEKIRQYEQVEKITKGDVVRLKSAPEVEILVTFANETYFSGIALTEVDDNCEIGDQYTNIVINKVEKTGRHYEIADVLRKMRE